MTKCTLCKNDIVLYAELQDSLIQIDHRFYHFECAIKIKNNHKIDAVEHKEDAAVIIPSKPQYRTKSSTSFWGRVQEKCPTCTRSKDHHTAQQVKECMT